MAMVICTVTAVTGFLRILVLKTDPTLMLVFLLLDLLCFAALVLIWPLVYRSKILASFAENTSQIVTMDEHFVNLHVTGLHEQFRWNKFVDIDEDDDYYYLFSEENYIVLDKKAFPEGGLDIFLSYHTPERLLREANRKSRGERYLMLFTKKDYLTQVVEFWNKTFKKKAGKAN